MEKISVYSTVKLWPTIGHNLLRYFESADYILPHKLDNIFIFDGGESFRFYPFAKIVGGNKQ